MKKQKKEIIPKRLKAFLTSYKPILIVLIVLIIILIGYCNYLLKSTKVYSFKGSSDYIEVYNGIISLNYDVNVLEGSDITYIKDKDIVVVDYKIGYYVKDGDNLLSIAVVEESDPEGLSLKKVLEGIGTFNIVELNTNNFHFNKAKTDLINNGLYFVIEATDKKGASITDITPMEITKLTK